MTDLTTKEAAKELGVATKTVTKWITEGQLMAHKVGARYRIKSKSIEDFLQGITPAESKEKAEEESHAETLEGTEESKKRKELRDMEMDASIAEAEARKEEAQARKEEAQVKRKKASSELERLADREKMVKEGEARLEQKKQELDQREKELDQRQKAIAAKLEEINSDCIEVLMENIEHIENSANDPTVTEEVMQKDYDLLFRNIRETSAMINRMMEDSNGIQTFETEKV